MLPRHTGTACQAKYRMVKNKEGNSDVQSTIDAPAIGKQGQSNEAEGGMEAGRGVENKDETTSAKSSSRNGFQAAGMDIQDHDNQGGGKKSMVAASSNAGQAEQDVGGVAAQDPITENTE